MKGRPLFRVKSWFYFHKAYSLLNFSVYLKKICVSLSGNDLKTLQTISATIEYFLQMAHFNSTAYRILTLLKYRSVKFYLLCFFIKIRAYSFYWQWKIWSQTF